MRFPDDIERLAFEIVAQYSREGKKIATAESCTGGLVAAAITSITGASAVFERGFVSYSNDSKIDVLGVLPDVLKKFGPTSPEIAEEMAVGALAYSHANVALSVTGIAGPSTGGEDKPIGLVCFGIATKEGARFHATMNFRGDRNTVRYQAVVEGLTLLLSLVQKD
ncbi:MAG: CinA family protein [Alphaproteobacteria bacterium]|nr:CinA family protein [Alphaproteobacteria bacterium]